MLCLSLNSENEIHVKTAEGEAVIRLAERQPKHVTKVRLTFEAPMSVEIFRQDNTKPPQADFDNDPELRG